MKCPICNSELVLTGTTTNVIDDKCEIYDEYYCPKCTKVLSRISLYELKYVGVLNWEVKENV